MKFKTRIILIVALLVGSMFPIVRASPPDPKAPFANAYPLPESGAWFDPAEPGTGLFLELQNGTLVGTYFGFDGNGNDAWLLFTGPLVAGKTTANNDDPEVVWDVEANLDRFTNGRCIVDCTGGQSDNTKESSNTVGTIRLEFLGRSLARFSVDGGPMQEIVPLLFGVPGFNETPETSKLFSPVLTGRWIFVLTSGVFRDDAADMQQTYPGYVFDIGARKVSTKNGHQIVEYVLTTIDSSDSILSTQMTCNGGGCSVNLRGLGLGVDAFIKLKNISDSRLMSVPVNPLVSPPDPIRLDAFRLGYD